MNSYEKPLEVKGDMGPECGMGERVQRCYSTLSPPRQKHGDPDKLVWKPFWMGNSW